MTGFAALHRPGRPFVLPNAWDVVSGRMFQDSGFPAVGTSSLGISAAAGLPDGVGSGLDETCRLVEALGRRLTVPLSVDLEGGFSEDPDRVAALCQRLSGLGAAGVNLEDGRRDPAAHAEIVGAVADACPGLFVNARTDVFWLGLGPADGRAAEAAGRLCLYARAGAHGVFAPGLSDLVAIAALAAAVPAPLNVLWSAQAGVGRLAAAGAARVSTGSALFRAALTAARSAAHLAAGLARPSAVEYDEVQALVAPIGGDRG